jgi:hypothetical protein
MSHDFNLGSLETDGFMLCLWLMVKLIPPPVKRNPEEECLLVLDPFAPPRQPPA